MSPPTTIRVAPNTRFSLEIGKAGTQQQTNLGLMIGCVTVKCAKLSGSQSVRVQTDSALMGVRGTSFTVTAAASGDLLVDCEEGEVECTDEQGVIERAVTGEVVEKLLDARMQRRPVAGQGLAAASHRLDQQIARVRVAARLYARFHDDVLPGGGFAGRDDPGAFVE